MQEDLVEKYRIPVGNDEISYVNICMNCTGYQGITSTVRVWSSSLGYRNITADDIIKREIERFANTLNELSSYECYEDIIDYIENNNMGK